MLELMSGLEFLRVLPQVICNSLQYIARCCKSYLRVRVAYL